MSFDQDDLHQPAQTHPLPAHHDHEQDVSLSMLTNGLARMQDQVKFADAKGGFLATLAILVAGFVVQPASHVMSLDAHVEPLIIWGVRVLLCLYLATTFLAVTFVLMAVMPRLVDSSPNTMTFFSHVRKQFGMDHARYYESARRMTPEDWAMEVSAQIVAVSSIADQKHRLIHRATRWMVVSLALWMALIATIQFVR